MVLFVLLRKLSKKKGTMLQLMKLEGVKDIMTPKI
jgi:hypothetical protein